MTTEPFSRSAVHLVGSLVICAAILVAPGCGSSSSDKAEPGSPPQTSSVPASTSATPTSSVPASTSATPTPIDGVVAADGHGLYVECAGTGSPTIVFLHGIGGDRTHGTPLLSEFSSRTRVCTYDRANMGLSDKVSGVLTGADAVEDLHALLGNANIPPPYLLVGGSFGGLLSLIFAGAHPQEVKGMVLIDASLPSDADIDQLLVDRGLIDPIEPTDEYANGGETFFYSIHDEARTAVNTILDIPVTYLRASEFEAPPGAPKEEMAAIGKQWLDEFLAQFSNGRVVDVKGPHFPFPQQPINDAISDVLNVVLD